MQFGHAGIAAAKMLAIGAKILAVGEMTVKFSHYGVSLLWYPQNFRAGAAVFKICFEENDWRGEDFEQIIEYKLAEIRLMYTRREVQTVPELPEDRLGYGESIMSAIHKRVGMGDYHTRYPYVLVHPANEGFLLTDSRYTKGTFNGVPIILTDQVTNFKVVLA